MRISRIGLRSSGWCGRNERARRLSPGVIALVLGGSVVLSLLFPKAVTAHDRAA